MIIDTDLGRDPDDFLTLCYLHAAGVNIEAILVNPGDRDQIAVAKFFCKEVGLKIPVGSCKNRKDKKSSGGIHYDLMDACKHPREADPDDTSENIINSIATENSDVLIIGPATTTGTYLKNNKLNNICMQGGFVPYILHEPRYKLNKFIGKAFVDTFNLNGDRPAGLIIADTDNVKSKRFCGKNICHTVEFSSDLDMDVFKAKDRASELFVEACSYLDSKKMHDPVAAVCMLHPEIGTWIQGKPAKMGSGWTTIEGTANMLVDIDYEKFWEYIYNFS